MNIAKREIYQDVSLSIRARNALVNAGFNTIEDCMAMYEYNFLAIPGLGKKTAKEIVQYLKQFKSNKLNLYSKNSNLSEDDLKERLEYLASVLSIPLPDIGLSVRARNVISKLNTKFLKGLVSLSPETILAAKNSGKKTLNEILQLLSSLGLDLEMRLEKTLKREIKRRIEISRNSKSAIEMFEKKYPEQANILNKIKIDIVFKNKVVFYKKCHELYKKGGTLKYVAKKTGLTRERIRQILVRGMNNSLFGYTPRGYTYIPKQKLIDDIIRFNNLSKVASYNKVSKVCLERMLFSYGINRKKINDLIFLGHKRKLINEYLKVKDELGHHPTTTELQAKPKWRALEARIRRTWKSIRGFREELNIPPPPPFVEAVRPWLEHRMRLAFIKRMQDLDIIRETLTTLGSLQTREIARHCKLNYMRALKLTQLLVSTGELIKEGTGSSTCYRISNDGR